MPCLRMNNADFAIYVIYYTKYPDIFQNKMAFTDCETCQFITFLNTKFSKTAGLWRCHTSEFGLFIIYPNFLSCFQLVPEGGQRKSFSKRFFVPENTAYIHVRLNCFAYLNCAHP